VSDYRNDFSEALALRAIQLVFRYLPEVYKNGESIEAKSKMHSAATMAGLAFGNAQLSISH
jgi:acetaldehyde dehydrogenase/alcohol dehydrogenase